MGGDQKQRWLPGICSGELITALQTVVGSRTVTATDNAVFDPGLRTAIKANDAPDNLADSANDDAIQSTRTAPRRVDQPPFAPSPLYSLRYQGNDGLLDVNGLQMTEDEFEAFRFFTVGVDQGQVAGYEGLVGNAWHEDGPLVVTWRESNGLVVRIVGIGVPLDATREVASAARELTTGEWVDLVEADDRCESP